MADQCRQPDCDRDEEMANGRSTGGYCAGHRYRKRRGLPMEPPLHDGLARRRPAHLALIEAALNLADCPNEESADPEFRRRTQLLAHAALVYAPTVQSNAPAIIDSGVYCPHCKLVLVLTAPRNIEPAEVAKRARLALLQHVVGCPKKAKP